MRAVLIGSLLVSVGCGGGGGGGGAADAGPDAAGAVDATPPDAATPVLAFDGYVDGALAPLPWVALQDGDGDWQELASADGHYSAEIPSGRYGIAHVCPGDHTSMRIVYGTVAEAATLQRSCGFPPAVTDTGSLDVTVNGLGASASATVWGPGGGLDVSAGAPTASFTTVPTGTSDVITTYRSDGSNFDGVTIDRGVAVNSGATTSLAVDATSAAAIVTSSIAVTGATGGETVQGLGWFYTTAQGSANLRIDDTSYGGVPDSVLADGDVQEVTVTASSTGHMRTVVTWMHQAADVALALPTPLAATAVGATTEPYVRPDLGFEQRTDVTVFEGAFNQTARDLDVIFTAGWLGPPAPDGRYYWTLPDFSALPGFNGSWALTHNILTPWLFAATTTDRDITDVLVPTSPSVRHLDRTDLSAAQFASFRP